MPSSASGLIHPEVARCHQVHQASFTQRSLDVIKCVRPTAAHIAIRDRLSGRVPDPPPPAQATGAQSDGAQHSVCNHHTQFNHAHEQFVVEPTRVSKCQHSVTEYREIR